VQAANHAQLCGDWLVELRSNCRSMMCGTVVPLVVGMRSAPFLPAITDHLRVFRIGIDPGVMVIGAALLLALCTAETIAGNRDSAASARGDLRNEVTTLEQIRTTRPDEL